MVEDPLHYYDERRAASFLSYQHEAYGVLKTPGQEPAA
jgi:hypothetical protein